MKNKLLYASVMSLALMSQAKACHLPDWCHDLFGCCCGKGRHSSSPTIYHINVNVQAHADQVSIEDDIRRENERRSTEQLVRLLYPGWYGASEWVQRGTGSTPRENAFSGDPYERRMEELERRRQLRRMTSNSSLSDSIEETIRQATTPTYEGFSAVQQDIHFINTIVGRERAHSAMPRIGDVLEEALPSARDHEESKESHPAASRAQTEVISRGIRAPRERLHTIVEAEEIASEVRHYEQENKEEQKNHHHHHEE